MSKEFIVFDDSTAYLLESQLTVIMTALESLCNTPLPEKDERNILACSVAVLGSLRGMVKAAATLSPEAEGMDLCAQRLKELSIQ